jgi:DNA repair exonuclease SbcCD ATPase subunit
MTREIAMSREKNIDDAVNELREISKEIREINQKLEKLKYFEDSYNKDMFQIHIVRTYLNPITTELSRLGSTVGCSSLLMLGVLAYIAYFISKGHW